MKTRSLHSAMGNCNLILRLIIFFLLMSGLPSLLNAATVVTDKPDYYPGETVTITGSDWYPGETVTLVIHHMTYTSHPDQTIYTIALVSGDILNASYVIDPSDLGETFLLTATGQSSGLFASTTFTDAQLTITSVVPSSGTYLGGTAVTINGSGFGNAGAIITLTFGGIAATNVHRSSANVVTATTPAHSIGTVDVEITVNGVSATLANGYTYDGCTAPTISCPSDISTNSTSGTCGASITFAATSTGTPTPTIAYTVSGTTISSPYTFPVGTTTVTATATNSCGSASCSFTVNVTDNENPVLVDPSDLAENNDPTFCYKVIVLTAPTATDNCGISVAGVTASGIPADNKFPVGTTTVTWSVTDIHGNTSTQTQDIVITDNENPVLVDPSDIAENNDPSFCYKVIVLTAPTATDNCGISVAGVTATGIPADNKFPVGTTTVTWSVTDIHGNTSTQTQDIVITDNEKPVITCPSAITIATDSGHCYATIDNLGMPVTSDNCGISGYTNNAPSDHRYPFGSNSVIWTVTDTHGNTNTCVQTINVNKVTTVTSVTVSPTAQQYSDEVVFTATVTPYSCDNAGNAATSVTFKVGSQVMGTALLDNAGIATATYSLLEPVPFGTLPTGQMAPGGHPVTALFNGVDSDFTINDPTTTLTITKEDARATYTGALFACTSSSTSSIAIITLAATIQDITAVIGDPAYDVFGGDIRNAKVMFVNRDNNAAISGWLPVGLVNSADPKTGTVVYNWTVNIGNSNSADFTVGIIVDGYYTRDMSIDNAVVTVSKPLDDFITGGGYVKLQNSAGIKAGDFDSKNNFGFNVKYTKKLTNLQGHINTIVRRTESGTVHVYQVKGNSMTSLAVTPATSSMPAEAIFNGKASIQDITNPYNPIPIDGNATLQVTMTDLGEPGSGPDEPIDRISITVWNKNGGLWFASNWDGTNTIKQVLDGGNLQVHSSNSYVNGNQSSTTTIASSLNPSLVGSPVTFTATVTGSSGTPSGKLSFMDYTTNTVLATVNLNNQGVATYHTSNLPAGPHEICAYYGGNSTYKFSADLVLQNVNAELKPVMNDEASGQVAMKIYPNPFIDRATIEFSLPGASTVFLEVYNLTGVKIATLYQGVAEADRKYSIEFTPGMAIGSGMFYCVLRTDFGKRIGKMIMTR